ncbi:Malate synthase [Streptomyces noursei ATCC 11455]|nr:Malate synthase [Streptomyces noursei ATCC 11455]
MGVPELAAEADGEGLARFPSAAAAALATVRLDKEREAEDGFDWAWVAHPGLVPVCRAAFDEVLGARPHQLDRTRDEVAVTAADLLSVRRTSGPPTPDGVRTNTAVALGYFDAWLRGQGAVALDGARRRAAAVLHLRRLRPPPRAGPRGRPRRPRRVAGSRRLAPPG